MFLGSLVLIFTNAIAKLSSIEYDKAPVVLVVMCFSAFLTSLVLGYKKIATNKKYFLPILKINLIQGGLYFFYFVMLMNVYRNGDLGISYKIQSYSPFIPIILSAFIYKEKISKKKKIALILVAISLWFFH